MQLLCLAAIACQFEQRHQYAGKDVLLNLSISNGNVTAHNLDKIVWRIRGVETIAQIKAVSSALPDVNLLINLHDGPGVLGTVRRCGIDKVYAYAVCPTWPEIKQYHLPVMLSQHNPFCDHNCLVFTPPGRCCKKSTEPPWELKQNRAVWRGSPSDRSGEATTKTMHTMWKRHRALRLRAVLLGKNRTDIVDAAFSKYGVASNLTLVPQDNRIPFGNFFKYKYVLDIDGAGGSFRLASLLMSNSIVIRSSRYSYWFLDSYKDSYVDVNPDFSNLIQTIQALIGNTTLQNIYRKKIKMAHRRNPFSPAAQLRSWFSSLPSFMDNKSHRSIN